MPKNEIFMDTSKEAAMFVTNIKGWVSRGGIFFGNNSNSENAARYKGCTHRACDGCGKPAEKMYTHCPRCREIRAGKRYMDRKTVAWDGKAPVYSEVHDKYFFDAEDLSEFMFDMERTSSQDMRLVLCEPKSLKTIDEDHWCDELPEDGELPEAVISALKDFNDAIRAADTVSWVPGNFRVIF